jgi:hypothetical protein
MAPDQAIFSLALTVSNTCAFPTKDPVADWVALAEQVQSASFLFNHHNAVSCFRREYWLEVSQAHFDVRLIDATNRSLATRRIAR